MAGVFFNGTSGEVSLTAGAEKTAVQIIAPTNQRVLIHEIHVSFKGTSVTEIPIDVQIKRQVNAPGGGSAMTISKENASDDEAIQTTAVKNPSSEPSPDGNDAIIKQVKVHPQDSYHWMYPLLRPLPVRGGSRLGIVVNSPQSATVVVSIRGEE